MTGAKNPPTHSVTLSPAHVTVRTGPHSHPKNELKKTNEDSERTEQKRRRTWTESATLAKNPLKNHGVIWVANNSLPIAHKGETPGTTGLNGVGKIIISETSEGTLALSGGEAEASGSALSK